MLGKLLKYEFRATSRTMLPALAVLTVLIILSNISVRLLDTSVGTLLRIVAVLVLILTFIALFAAEIIPIVLMIQRYHRNILSSEGYLMHTLPVSVHSLVWSKLIVSLVWLLVINLALFLLGSLSVLFLSGTNLGELFAGFPSWAEIRAFLARADIGMWEILLPMAELQLIVILSGLVVCLYFYASMSLGYMFTRKKGLMSALMFIALGVVLSILVNTLSYAGLRQFSGEDLSTAIATLRTIRIVLGGGVLILLLEAGLLYAATTLSLKKGLNLG